MFPNFFLFPLWVSTGLSTNREGKTHRSVRFFIFPNLTVQSIATGIEGLDCSKSSQYKLCTTSPIKLYHERVSQTGFVFPIFWGYKLIDKPVQNLYGLVLQSRPHSIPVASDCTGISVPTGNLWDTPLVKNNDMFVPAGPSGPGQRI